MLLVCNRYIGLNCEDFEAEQSEYSFIGSGFDESAGDPWGGIVRTAPDEIHPGPEFTSNHAGRILGGISTGQDIVTRFSVKPTSSILTPRATITKSGEATEIVTKGRHDPCVGIRAVPVGEAMAACVMVDHLLLDRAQTGGVRGKIG